MIVVHLDMFVDTHTIVEDNGPLNQKAQNVMIETLWTKIYQIIVMINPDRRVSPVYPC